MRLYSDCDEKGNELVDLKQCKPRYCSKCQEPLRLDEYGTRRYEYDFNDGKKGKWIQMFRTTFVYVCPNDHDAEQLSELK